MKEDTQKQSEALIRLLLAARYQDSKLSLSEGDAFNKQIESLPWSSGTGLSVFVMMETSRVRKALATDGDRQKFLEEQCAQFATPDSKSYALQTLESLLKADGVDPKESRFLAHVGSILRS